MSSEKCNGRLSSSPNSSPSTSLGRDRESVADEMVLDEPPPVVQIEVGDLSAKCYVLCELQRDLDELTYSGAAINELEVQLIRKREEYQKVLIEGRRCVDLMRKKLHSHIVKSEPFIALWRKSRQVSALLCSVSI